MLCSSEMSQMNMAAYYSTAQKEFLCFSQDKHPCSFLAVPPQLHSEALQYQFTTANTGVVDQEPKTR